MMSVRIELLHKADLRRATPVDMKARQSTAAFGLGGISALRAGAREFI